MPGMESVQLRAAGWLGKQIGSFLRAGRKVAGRWSRRAVSVCGSTGAKGEAQSLARPRCLSIPTVYLEPKGIFVLEALASGVPVCSPITAPSLRFWSHRGQRPGASQSPLSSRRRVEPLAHRFHNPPRAGRARPDGSPRRSSMRNAWPALRSTSTANTFPVPQRLHVLAVPVVFGQQDRQSEHSSLIDDLVSSFSQGAASRARIPLLRFSGREYKRRNESQLVCSRRCRAVSRCGSTALPRSLAGR